MKSMMEVSDVSGIHGFVHGHIHKHKDHTHIHGHIHNHEHDDHYNPEDLCDINESACRDIMCDELDDCHFNHCEEVELPPVSHLDLATEPAKICTDDLCFQDPNKVVLDCCGDLSDSDNCSSLKMCESQQPNALFFKNIIENVQMEMDQGNQPPPKRIKTEDESKFELHFPHSCHPVPAIPEEAKQDHHHYHQLCFHTTIPNEYQMPPPPIPEPPQMLDFDFFIQFNNMAPPICKWDNCEKSLDPNQLLRHLETDHHVKPNGHRYQCGWLDCDYNDDLWEQFIAHVTEHQPDANPVVPPANNVATHSAASTTNLKPLLITKMKIRLKKRQEIDPTFTCKWEVATGIACNLLHPLAGALQQHLIDEHVGLGRLEYYCQWQGCDRHHGKVFVQRQKLLRHIHIHTNYKPFKCEECGLCFATEQVLQQHLRTHLGEKPFVCQYCGKRFAANSSLLIHHRTHTGDKPLVCKYPGCGKRFLESSNLTKHMKVHEKERV